MPKFASLLSSLVARDSNIHEAPTYQTRLDTWMASYKESPGDALEFVCARAEMVNPRFVAIKVHNAEGASSQDLFTSNTVEVFDEQSILLV